MTRLAELWTELFVPVSAAMLGANGIIDDATIRRWAAATGRTRLSLFLRLASARWAALREAGLPAPRLIAVMGTYRRAVRIAYRDPVELSDLGIDGEDLLREGIARGPALGKILRALLDWVVDDPTRNTRDQLLARARTLAGASEHE
jgi:tRNA nucleotidyltransferase (CCA-adding enzyme)